MIQLRLKINKVKVAIADALVLLKIDSRRSSQFARWLMSNKGRQ